MHQQQQQQKKQYWNDFYKYVQNGFNGKIQRTNRKKSTERKTEKESQNRNVIMRTHVTIFEMQLEQSASFSRHSACIIRRFAKNFSSYLSKSRTIIKVRIKLDIWPHDYWSPNRYSSTYFAIWLSRKQPTFEIAPDCTLWNIALMSVISIAHEHCHIIFFGPLCAPISAKANHAKMFRNAIWK